jgi:hypothetical protein
MSWLEPSQKALETLLRVVERSSKVSEKTNAELAETLVDLTGESNIDSYFYLVLMECAFRLAPEIFPPEGE